MAPALSSNSFLLNTAPSSRLSSLRNPRLTVFAKRASPFPPFRLGKPADDSSAEESVTDDKPSSNPFSFNFGKVSDVKSLIPVVANPSAGLSFGSPRRKDPGTVFVAGATGQAGIRIAQTLLREGFTVRAGVADLGAAQELARLAAQYKIISKEESKRLNAVESTFQDAESIAKAIGNASKVVVTIGPAENGPTSEVTTSDAAQVIQAAQLAGVGHVAIVYDGTSTSTSTYNVLDGISLFFNNLFSRSQPLTVPEFLQKVVEAGVSYTLIKTRLTEDLSPESSYNVVVSAEGSLDANDYKVAKSQIASLVANVFANTAVAENKVVKVFTDPAAPLKPVDELFSAIPEDGRRKAYAESIAKEEAEEEARKATAKAVEAAKVAKRIEADIKKLEEQEARAASLAEEAQEKAAAAGASVEGLLDKAKEIGSGLSWEKFSSQLATAVQNTTEKPKVAASLAEEAQEKAAAAGASVEGLLDKAKEIGSGLSWEKFSSQLATVQNTTEKPKVQIATVRGQAKAQTLLAKKAVIKTPTPKRKQKEPPKPKQTQTESKPETRKLFGGLFQQETIYVDD